MRELFIYYRVRSPGKLLAEAAVAAFQARLRERHPFLIARLLQRPEAIDGSQTWMETYATDPMNEPSGVTPELQAEIDAAASIELAALLDGPRHVEVFVACAW